MLDELLCNALCKKKLKIMEINLNFHMKNVYQYVSSSNIKQGSILRRPKIAETIQDLKSKNAVGIV